jgi:hypothetical protein
MKNYLWVVLFFTLQVISSFAQENPTEIMECLSP